MYYILSCFLVFIEILIYFKLLQKYSLKSGITLVYTIILFYGASPVFDGLIYGVKGLNHAGIYIDLYSDTSFIVQVLYFSILFPFGILCLKNQKIKILSLKTR